MSKMNERTIESYFRKTKREAQDMELAKEEERVIKHRSIRIQILYLVLMLMIMSY